MYLFVIGGKARSGKSTFGRLLKNNLEERGFRTCVMKITGPLYSYAKNYFDWNERHDSKPREFLQKLGVEIIQEKMGKKEFLLNRLCEDIEILDNFFDVAIITDARLIHEFEVLKKRYDMTSIKMERVNFINDLTDEEKKHITETELDNYNRFNYVISNNNLDDLNGIAKEIVKNEENEIRRVL